MTEEALREIRDVRDPVGSLLRIALRYEAGAGPVAPGALTFGYFAALEQWPVDGGDHPIASYVEEGMRPLRGMWSS